MNSECGVNAVADDNSNDIEMDLSSFQSVKAGGGCTSF